MARTKEQSPYAVAGVAALAVVVIGGIGWGWSSYNSSIEEVTSAAEASALPTPDASEDPTDEPSDEPSEEPSETSTPSVEPSFSPLEATDGRDAPVVLVVGGGVAAGTGTSGEEAAWPQRLADETGWEVVVSAAPGIGYRPVESVGVSRYLGEAQPQQTAPDLVIIQAQDLPGVSDDDLRTSVANLSERLAGALPDVPVVAVAPLPPAQADPARELREQIVARNWRQGPAEVLILRPAPDDWGVTLPYDPADDALPDADQATMTDRLVTALQDANLL